MTGTPTPYDSATICALILSARGCKVILDADLARIYGVPTKALNQAVKRNRERFPEDFMFRLTKSEKDEAVTNCDRLVNLKYSSALPCAFTEHGAMAIMANGSQKSKADDVELTRQRGVGTRPIARRLFPLSGSNGQFS